MLFEEQTSVCAEKISTPKRPRIRARSAELLVRTHKEGVACLSVVGPPNLKSVAAIHREVPTIPLDPPGNGPDVTQIKKIRQHKSKIFYQGDFPKLAKQENLAICPRLYHRKEKLKTRKNRLRLQRPVVDSPRFRASRSRFRRLAAESFATADYSTGRSG